MFSCPGFDMLVHLFKGRTERRQLLYFVGGIWLATVEPQGSQSESFCWMQLPGLLG